MKGDVYRQAANATQAVLPVLRLFNDPFFALKVSLG